MYRDGDADHHEDHTGDSCAICGDTIEDDWVLTLDGPAHPECDEERAKRAVKAYNGETDGE